MKYFILVFFCFATSLVNAQSSFATAEIIATPENISSRLDAGVPTDYNNDGLLDYLYSEVVGFVDRFLYVLEQQADGSFNRVELSENDGFYVIDADDVNGDGNVDILALSNLFINQGDNDFGTVDELQDAGIFYDAIDVNADGLTDYLTSSNLSDFDGRLAVLLGQPDGTFQTLELNRPEVGGGYSLAKDVIGDARPEIISAISDKASIISIGADELTESFTIEDSRIQRSTAEVIDFDSDGDRDILLAGVFNDIYLWRQVGNGYATELEVLNNAERIVDIDVFDVDGDGDEDIVTTGGQTDVEVLLYDNLGGGSFSVPTVLYETSPQINAFFAFGNANENELTQGDFNGDGKPDLILFMPENNEILYLENTSKIISDLFEPTKVGALEVFPNPTEGFISIKNPEQGSWSDLRLYDLRGQLIRRWSETGIQQLNISDLPAGNYYLQGLSSDGARFGAELIKQ